MSDSSDDLSLSNWIERFLYGPNYRYREGRIGYHTQFMFNREFPLKTPDGRFRGHVRLHGFLKRVDNHAFNEAKMLEQARQAAVSDSFYHEIAEPELEKCLLRFGIDRSSEVYELLNFVSVAPKIWLLRKGNGVDEPAVFVDDKYRETLKAINDATT